MISSIKRKETVLASANLPEGVVRTKLRSRTNDLVDVLIDRLMDGLACWERVQDEQVDVAAFAVTLSIECDRVYMPEEAKEDEEDEEAEDE